MHGVEALLRVKLVSCGSLDGVGVLTGVPHCEHVGAACWLVANIAAIGSSKVRRDIMIRSAWRCESSAQSHGVDARQGTAGVELVLPGLSSRQCLEGGLCRSLVGAD